MSEKPIVQRDLLGNIIERKIPRSVQVVPGGQITLDKFVEKLNNPGVDVFMIRESEISVNRRGKKRGPRII